MNQSVGNLTSLLTSLDIPLKVGRMTLRTQTFRIAVIKISTLINVFTALVIRFSRQLHYPRHLHWVAISVVNQFCLIQAVFQLVALLGQTQNKVACQFYVFNAGVFYTIILSFLTLAALDRYLAVARYEWYKKKVTNRRTFFLLSFVFIVTYMVLTSPFWTGFKNIKNCTINLHHMHAYLVYDLFLGILCITLHIMIFIRSRKIIRPQPPNFLETPAIALQFRPAVSISGISDFPVVVEPRQGETQIGNEIDATTNALQHLESQLDDTICFPWFLNRPKLNRLENRAALSMSVNMLPFWLCTFPVTIVGIAVFWCFRLQSKCPVILLTNQYLVDWFTVHTIYNLLMYMFTSKEFKRALIHLKNKIKFCNGNA